MLQWHYRSRHESLIAFSNLNFYESRLVYFPSPWGQSDEFGVKLTQIPEGRFLNGVNNIEALTVAKAMKAHFLSSKESLGVVAMNAKQADLIKSELESLAASDEALAKALKNQESFSESDCYFVKNLENVQGDERDVIFISFTYGPAERGSISIPQRFGPINSANGWRRLNVLFTRAKKRIVAFSSMHSGQIVLSDASSRGVRALKDYLSYAETGRLTGLGKTTGREPDSDFEVAVIHALKRHGFDCEAQLGVEGYFIDVAVIDPGMRGRYLMGIECDGATYHRAKSARDRDKVRQGVLEGLGWTIRRIWSTDWFKNPDAELKPIIDELKQLSTPITEQIGPDLELLVAEKAAYDEVEKTENEFYVNSRHSESLLDRLIRFDSEVIVKGFPNTNESDKLLRPDMLDRLVEYKPKDKDEFMDLIPLYLRKSTDMNEADSHLADVLEIIAEFDEMSVE